MNRAQRLDVPLLVFHPGAHVGKGERSALRRIATNLDHCIENADAPDVTLCLENTAGQGSVVGYKFEHLKSIMDAAKNSERLAVCFDTCHAYAAGYDIRTEEGFDKVLENIDSVIGIDLVKAFHLNDSVGELGSHLDRHEHIGRGKLGKAPFGYLMRSQRFKDIPGNIETPDVGGWNRRNLNLLRSFRVL
jgi:deoxyribonuclease-4